MHCTTTAVNPHNKAQYCLQMRSLLLSRNIYGLMTIVTHAVHTVNDNWTKYTYKQYMTYTIYEMVYSKRSHKLMIIHEDHTQDLIDNRLPLLLQYVESKHAHCEMKNIKRWIRMSYNYSIGHKRKQQTASMIDNYYWCTGIVFDVTSIEYISSWSPWNRILPLFGGIMCK